MKKFAPIISCVLLLFSCTTEDTDISTNATYPTEAGKQALENNSIAMLAEIENLENDPALAQVEEFAKFMIANEPASKSGKKIVGRNIRNVLNFKKVDLQNFSKAQLAAVTESAEGLQADFNEQAGTWIWNDVLEKFEQTKNSSDEIIFKVTLNNKNAELTISNFSVIKHPSGDEITTSISTVLTVENSTVFSQDFSTSFPKGKYIAESVSNTITISNLTFITNASNNGNNTESKISTAILLNGNIFIDTSVKVTGNYTELENAETPEKEINTLINTVSATYTMLNATISIETTSPNTVDHLTMDQALALANDNLKISLSVNNKKVANGEFYTQSDLKSVYNWHEEKKVVILDQSPRSNFSHGQIDLLNTYTEFENSPYFNNYYIFYYSDDFTEVILKETVVSEDIYNFILDTYYPNGKDNSYHVYSNPNYDYYLSNYYETEELVDSPNLKFVFDDGSKANIEAYFNAGFDKIQTKVEDVFINYEDRREKIN